jgi:hypothetical protein
VQLRPSWARSLDELTHRELFHFGAVFILFLWVARPNVLTLAEQMLPSLDSEVRVLESHLGSVIFCDCDLEPSMRLSSSCPIYKHGQPNYLQIGDTMCETRWSICIKCGSVPGTYGLCRNVGYCFHYAAPHACDIWQLMTLFLTVNHLCPKRKKTKDYKNSRIF